MKKIILLAVVVISAYVLIQELGISMPGYSLWNQKAGSKLQNAYQNKQSNVQVQGEGIVTKILHDDLKGSRHQRFLLRLNTVQTLMIAHNIDVAPKINKLRSGDSVIFYGEYEWNEKGGVVHWTHRDPAGRHVGGWLQHNGTTYQ